MTKKDALTIALNFVPADEGKAREIITSMIEQLSKQYKTSEKSRAKAKAKRADARATLMAQVLPILRDALTEGGTAKEIFERCADALPADFTAAKVQYILLHELADEVVKTEQKNKANTYTPR